jgi:hypothetical protein
MSTYYKCNLSAITNKVNISRYMLIWPFILVFECATTAESSSAPFDYTLYIRRAMHKRTFVSVEMRHTNLTGAHDKLLHNSALTELE